MIGNFVLDTHCGDSFNRVSEKAKQLACGLDLVVEFDFNDVKCIVDKTTNLEWLHRDYINSSTMEWKVVGPKCEPIYEIEVLKEFEVRTKLKEEKYERERIEYAAKEEKERIRFEEKVRGVEIELKDKEGWETVIRVNDDPYGKCTIQYTEGWAKLMQVEISNGKTIAECAEKTSFELGFLGITGFMYGCAVSILSQCWIHGEELRKWHNKDYRHEGDGVVNSAILTLNVS